MQSWFIKIIDGEPVDQPISAQNMYYLFENFDGTTPPPGFEIIQVPEQQRTVRLGVYETHAESTYERVDGVLQLVYNTRPMTPDEILAKQSLVKQKALEMGLCSWILDERTCRMKPPISYPTDGNAYTWDETTTSWKAISS